MSWPQGQGQRQSTPVTGQVLEERINMYISAMDKAGAMNDGHQSSQLQRDIQRLVDLMEKVSAGQIVTESEVPPPLVITPQVDVLANPLGELSSRLADYHKALYFAEEELSEDRINKIQRLQRGLQQIHDLQKRAQAGFPVRADEIPPPVTIPSDDEFDNDAVDTLTERLSQYKAALMAAENAGETERRRIPKIQSAMRTIEFLMTRARARRPVWKRDIPPEFDYYQPVQDETPEKPGNKSRYILQLRSLSMRLANLYFPDAERNQKLDQLTQRVKHLGEMTKTSTSPVRPEDSFPSLARQVDELEKQARIEKMRGTERLKEDLALVETRIKQYKEAAVNCKRDKQVSHAIQHLKVVKGLQPLKDTLEKGEPVDMTLVPPPPRAFTPTSESPPPFTEPEADTKTKASATAHLSPVNIKPPVETAEDKLAKKLSCYLDEGESHQPSTSEQMKVIQNSIEPTTTSAQLPPKVQNTSAVSGDSSSNALSNIGMLSCQNVAASQINTNLGKEDPESHPATTDENVSTSVVQSVDCQSEDAPQGIVVTTEADQITQGETQGNDTAEKQTPVATSESETSSNTSTPSPSKSADILPRKTLDSVGFLSCQNVPDSVPTLAGGLPDSVTQTGEKTQGASGVQGMQEHNEIPFGVEDISQGVNVTDSNTVSSLSQAPATGEAPAVFHDFSMNSKSGYYAAATDVTSGKDSVETSAMSDIVPNENLGLSECMGEVRHEWSSSGPSSITLPVYSPNKNIETSDSGPSSLPTTMVPKSETLKTLPPETNVPTFSHIPDIASSSVVPSDQNLIVESIIKDVIASETEKGAETVSQESSSDTQTAVASHDEILTQSGTKENSLTENDMLEFQDLMESMALPSMSATGAAAPAASVTSVNAGDGAGNTLHTTSEGAALSVSIQTPIASSATPAPISSEPSAWFTPSQDNQSRNPTTIAVSLDGCMDVENAASQPSASDQLGGVPQGSTGYYADKSLPNLTNPQGLLTNQTSDTEIRNLLSSQPSQGSNSIQGGQSNFASLNTWQQNSARSLQHEMTQPWSLPTGQPYHQSELHGLSTRSEVGGSGQTDVAFTCLENLKYDRLLKLSEGTEESRREELKLRAQFEQIKYKLRRGGKHVWLVYKACVEREHKELTQQIEDLHKQQRWSDAKMLSEKKSIAERELTVLNARLPELTH